MIIDPRPLSLTDWCDVMTFVLQKALTPPILLDPDHWKEWARVVIQSPGIAKFHPPRPDNYEDWKEWAIRFIQVVRL
jgi:hypothetical protein